MVQAQPEFSPLAAGCTIKESVKVWKGNQEKHFIAIASILEHLFDQGWILAEETANHIAAELPRATVIYAQDPFGTHYPCLLTPNMHAALTSSYTFRKLLSAWQHPYNLEDILDTMGAAMCGLLNPPIDVLGTIDLQPTKRQKRYDRLQVQKALDPDFYSRKRQYDRQYRERKKQARAQMSADAYSQLVALSEADRLAAEPFMN